MEKRIWTKEEIRRLILSSDAMVERSLSKLAARQTVDEFFAEDTKYHNDVGFNGADAKILTSFAKFLGFRLHLTSKQIFVARRKLLKYSGQLTAIANS